MECHPQVTPNLVPFIPEFSVKRFFSSTLLLLIAKDFQVLIFAASSNVLQLVQGIWEGRDQLKLDYQKGRSLPEVPCNSIVSRPSVCL